VATVVAAAYRFWHGHPGRGPIDEIVVMRQKPRTARHVSLLGQRPHFPRRFQVRSGEYDNRSEQQVGWVFGVADPEQTK